MTHPPFETKRIRDHVLRVSVGTRLDNSNATAMLELIHRARSEGVRFLILDCQSLQFLSSAGVGSILGAVDGLRQEGGDIILCGLPDQPRRVLEVLDLLEYLAVSPSLAEAEARCAQGSS